MVILAHCCTLDEKEHILRNAREHTDGLLATNPHHQIYQVGGDVIPEHDPHWDYEDCVGQGASLVVQWLRICLPMQGTRVRTLLWEDPTCWGATRPESHNY